LGLLKKYLAIKAEKDGNLCVGLDPASPYMRKDASTVPGDYFKSSSELEGLLSFTLDVIEKTGLWATAFKVNAQYAIPFSLAEYKKMTSAIKKEGALAIFDIKVNDIGSSNEACFYWAAQAGFDAVTYSPFAGNVGEAATQAHARNIDLFVLTLMSNPDAKVFMRSKIENGKPGYEWIASQIAQHKCAGAVVGATNTTAQEIKRIRELAGEDVIFLVPGVGAQGGDAERIFLNGGENLLINVGRSIIYSKNPRKTAEEYVKRFRNLRRGK